MALRLLGAAPWVVSSPRSAAQQQNALLLSGGFLVLRGDPETCEIGPNIKYMNIACTCTVTCFVVVSHIPGREHLLAPTLRPCLPADDDIHQTGNRIYFSDVPVTENL